MKNIKLALLVTAVAASLLSGCVSSEHINKTRTNVSQTSATVDAYRGKLNSQIGIDKATYERSQEVSRPYLVGKAVPLAREVSLPRALQKGIKTAILFPERRISLAVAGERIMLATGIVVTVAPDVYLPNSALLPRKSASDSKDATGAGAITPMPRPGMPIPGVALNAKGVQDIASGSSVAGINEESAYNFEFPQTEAPLGQILDMVSTRLGAHWKYDEARNTIRFYRLVTKSWQIPVSPASNSYSTKLDGSTTSTTNTNALTQKSSPSPISSESSGLNELESIRDSVNTVMTKSGSISANLATGTITLTDTSDAVDAADTLIQREVRILSRMVLLRLQTIQVTTSDNGESGVNWTAILQKAIKNLPSLSLTSMSPASLVSSNAGTIGLNVLSGSGDGTSAIISALHEIGDVQTSTELPMSTRNRHAIYYNVRNMYSYVSGTTPATATAGGTGGTPGITTAQDSVGLKLVLYPNATSKDTVMMTMALDQSVLQSLQSFVSGTGANAQTVQLPNVNGEGSSQEVPIKNGQTIVLTGFDRVSDQYDKRTLGNGMPLFTGGSLTSHRSRTTTIVLISAVVQDIDN